MPDQSSASTEHALMQEITAPLATLPDDPVPTVADVEFPIVLRGYDRESVDAYVQRTSQLVAELQATRSPEAAVRRALERVGEEVSGILQRAHDTAEKITTQSRSEAEDRMETARTAAERHGIVEDARELARQLLSVVDSAVERFPPAEDTETGETMPVTDPAAGELVGEPDGPEEDGEAADGHYDHASPAE